MAKNVWAMSILMKLIFCFLTTPWQINEVLPIHISAVQCLDSFHILEDRNQILKLSPGTLSHQRLQQKLLVSCTLFTEEKGLWVLGGGRTTRISKKLLRRLLLSALMFASNSSFPPSAVELVNHKLFFRKLLVKCWNEPCLFYDRAHVEELLRAISSGVFNKSHRPVEKTADDRTVNFKNICEERKWRGKSLVISAAVINTCDTSCTVQGCELSTADGNCLHNEGGVNFIYKTVCPPMTELLINECVNVS